MTKNYFLVELEVAVLGLEEVVDSLADEVAVADEVATGVTEATGEGDACTLGEV